MEKLDKNELKKLSPEERIKKLRELEENKRKELEETNSLIKQSLDELEEIQQVVEEKPPIEDNSAKFQDDQNLEEQIEQSNISTPKIVDDDSTNIEYAINLYDELTDMAINPDQTDNGYANMDRATEIYERIKETEKYQSTDQTVRNIAEGTRRIMKELYDDDHRADIKYFP
jgi:hypothetical protein